MRTLLIPDSLATLTTRLKSKGKELRVASVWSKEQGARNKDLRIARHGFSALRGISAQAFVN